MSKFIRLAALILTAGIASLSSSHYAIACAIGHVDIRQETIDAAKVIFRGSIEDYRVVDGNLAKLKFQVTDTYRGENRKSWELIWQNSTFSLPKDIDEYIELYGEDTVVGIANAGELGPGRAPVSIIVPPSNKTAWEYPWVMQSPCHPPMMVKWQGGNAFFDLFSLLVKQRIIPNTQP